MSLQGGFLGTGVTAAKAGEGSFPRMGHQVPSQFGLIWKWLKADGANGSTNISTRTGFQLDKGWGFFRSSINFFLPGPLMRGSKGLEETRMKGEIVFKKILSSV